MAGLFFKGDERGWRVIGALKILVRSLFRRLTLRSATGTPQRGFPTSNGAAGGVLFRDAGQPFVVGAKRGHPLVRVNE